MTCPSEPIPAGWQIWRGPVPAPLAQWAMAVRDRVNRYAYGSIAETMQYNGQTVACFKSHHTWTNRKQADGTTKLVTGICIAGIALLVPTPNGSGAVGGSMAPGPDAELAVYGADDVPRETNWGLVALGAGAILTVGLGFAWAIRKVPSR